MYAFCYKQRSLLSNAFALSLRISPIFELVLPIKCFSSEAKSIRFLAHEDDKRQQKHTFTVSYLMAFCGLSPETALSASKKVKFETSEGPDSVLALLRNHGFENAHISKLITKFPKLLLNEPRKTLMPKIEFYRSIGLSNSELPEFLCSGPQFLNINIEKRMVPICDFLKSIGLQDTEVPAVLRRCWRIPTVDVQRHYIPNIALLRGLGAPQSIIMTLVSSYPNVLRLKPDLFGAKAKEVINMGFDPSKWAFVQALAATINMSKSTWQHKFEIFKRWGWSDHEIDLALRKNPICFRLSEMKIDHVMGFLMNKMGVESTAIATHPLVLCYSLQGRIIPRCLVVRFLQAKGLLKKDIRMLGYLNLSDELFLANYVTKYEEQVPQLFDLYKGKVEPGELGVRTEDIKWQALL